MEKFEIILLIICTLAIVSDCQPHVCEVRMLEPCGDIQGCNCRTEDGVEICDKCEGFCHVQSFQECANGDCSVFGCKCWPCWSGFRCDIYNNEPPRFSEKVYVGTVDSYSNGVLRGITAFDPDSAHCLKQKTNSCPCNVLLYSLVEGSYLSRFTINQHTGDLAYDVTELREARIDIIIAVHNLNSDGVFDMFEDSTNFANVTLYVGKKITGRKHLKRLHQRQALSFWKDIESRRISDKPKARKKRQAVIPVVINTQLAKMNEWGSKSTIAVADSIPFQLTINITSGSTNLTVELSSTLDGLGFAIFSFDSITIDHIGSNLDVLTPNISIMTTSSANNNEVDKASITFGSIVNNGADMNSTTSNLVVVNFKTVVVNNNMDAGSNHSVYAGLVLDGGNTSLIKIETFTAIAIYLAKTISSELKTMDSWENKTTIGVADSIPFQLTIDIPNESTNLTVELFSTLDSFGFAIFHFCDITIHHIGSNLASLTTDMISILKSSSANNNEFDKASISFGNVVNNATATNYTDWSSIIVNITAVVVNPNMDIGTNYSVYVDVECDGGNTSLIENSTFTALTVDISSGHLSTVNISGPSASMLSIAELWEVSIYVPDAVNYVTVKVSVTGGTNHMSLCSVVYSRKGINYRCYQDDGITYDTSTPGEATVSFNKMINTGFNSTYSSSEDSTIIVNVIATIPADGAVGDNYTIDASLYLKGLLVHSDSYNVTAHSLSLPQSVGAVSLLLSHTDGSNSIPKGGRVFINASLQTVQNATENYKIKFNNPTVSSYTLHFCSAVLKTIGSNIPCWSSNLNTTFKSNVKENIYDELMVDLGTISNFGLTTDILEDQILIEIGICTIDDGLLEDGENVSVSAITTYGSNDFSTSITFQVNNIDVTTDQDPVFTLGHADGHTEVYPGGQTIYELAMDIPAFAAYKEVKVKVETYDSAYLISGVCDIYLVSVDDGLPCLARATPIFETSPLNPSYNKESTLSIGSIVNYGNSTTTLKLNIVIVLLDDDMSIGSSVTTNVSIVYNNNKTWTGSISKTYSVTLPSLSELPSYETSPPAIILPIGGAALIDLEIDSPSFSLSSYKVIATAINVSVSVCRIRVKTKGTNIPCLTDDLYQNFSHYQNYVGNQEISYDLYSVRNTGRLNTSDSHKMVVEIAAQLLEGFDYSTNTSHGLRISAYDSHGPYNTIVSLYAETTSTPSTPSPVMFISKLNGVSQITKGSAAVFAVDIYTNPRSMTSYSLSVSSTTGISSICDIRVIGGEKHVPCINDNGNRSYLSNDGNITFNGAIIDIGTLSNIAESGTVTDQNNKVSVEVVICIPASSTAVYGDSVTVSATLTYGGSQSISANTAVTVTNSLIPEEINSNLSVIYVPPNDGDIFVKIADIIQWKVNIIMPESTDRFIITLDLPYSVGEAAITAVNASYSFIGSNIGCKNELLSIRSFTSNVNSTQKTTLSIDLGYISNVGTYNRYQFRKQEDEDDLVQVTFDVQIADHPDNIHGSTKYLDFSMTSDGGMTSTETTSVIIQSTGDEVADLEFDLWIDSFSHFERTSEDMVKIYGALNLTNTSTAHASNVEVSIIIPYISEFVSLDNYTHVTPIVSTTGTYPTLNFPLVKYTDKVTFELSFIIDPNNALPNGMTDIRTVITADTTYTTLARTGRTDTTLHSTDLKSVEFGFDSPVCNSPLNIQYIDCQITASSEESIHPAIDMLPTSDGGWCPALRGAPFCGNEYLQVYLGNLTKVTGIGILSSANDKLNYITEFNIFYSNEGKHWYAINNNGTESSKNFSVAFNISTSDVNDTAITDLETHERFTARYVKLVPIAAAKNTCRPVARVQFYGCKTIADNTLSGQFPFSLGNILSDVVASKQSVAVLSDTVVCHSYQCTETIPVDCVDENVESNVCNTTDSSVKFTFSKRNYITNPISGTIFSCVESNIDSDVACSKSSDNGVSWQEIDITVGRIDGVISNTTTVLGTSQDGRSRVYSEDDGLSWCFYSDEEYNEMIATVNYISAIDFPFNDFVTSTEDMIYMSHGQTLLTYGLTGTMNGMSIKDLNTNTWSELSVRWGDDDWTNL